MRKIALAVVILSIVMCMFASGTQRETVKVYFTVGPLGSLGATQLWRCNRDGSEPELLHEGTELFNVDIDSGTQRLFFTEAYELCAADLDCAVITTGIGYNVATYSAPALDPAAVFPVDAEGGYLSSVDCGQYVYTSLVDVSDQQLFDVTEVVGVPASPIVADVALYVTQGSSVESTTWGAIKSKFRR